MLEFANRFLNSQSDGLLLQRASPCCRLWILTILIAFGAGNELLADAAIARFGNNPPWGQQERLEYAVYETVGGDQIGVAVFQVESTEREGQPLWKIRIETLLDQPAVTIVEVDRGSFLPVYSYYRSAALGEIEAAYRGNGVSIERRLNSQPKQLRQDASTYDLYQTCYLMRLFPIEEGFQQKVFVTNSKRPVEQSPATLKIVDIRELRTRSGERVLCYRVDVRIDELRSSFWISADERRWLYRVVDESGISFELIPPTSGQSEPRTFRSESYGYEFELPQGWLAFVREKRKGPDRQEVAVLIPGIDAELTLTRHRRFGDLSSVAEGSRQWLMKNRNAFEVLQGSEESFTSSGGTEVQWFSGRYRQDDQWKYLFNAVLIAGENLIILTSVADPEDYQESLASIQSFVRSVQVMPGKQAANP